MAAVQFATLVRSGLFISSHQKVECVMAIEKTFQHGEKILSEGTFGTETFLIQSGQVLIQKETDTGAPVVLTVLHEGDVFGEMYLFEDVGFRSASAVAEGVVNVQVVDKQEMMTHLEKTPDIIQTILKSLNKRLVHTSQDYSTMLARQVRRNEAANKRNTLLLIMLIVVQLAIFVFK